MRYHDTRDISEDVTASRPASSGTWVQPSLEVGSVDDPHEREADAVADQVMALLRRERGVTIDARPERATRVRRATPPADAASPAQRIARSRIHRAEHQVGPEGGRVDTRVEGRINSARGGGAPLPEGLGDRMGQAFGVDFSNVRIHDDSASHDLNRSLQARAFTTRNDVFLAASAPDLASKEGTRLLAHELTHVVQQTGGARRLSIARVGADRSALVRRAPTPPADAQVAIANAKAALAAHKKDRAALMKIVREGAKSSHRRTQNACQWILDGRTKLYALNATGDRDERIAHLGEDPATTETWFPTGDGGPGDLLSSVANYNPLDLDDQTNVNVDDDDGPSTNGWNGDGYIAVMMRGGAMKKEQVLETLRHEVQHDSDKNREKEQTAVPIAEDLQASAGDLAKAFEGYKTEYRAYNYQAKPGTGYDRLSPTKVVTKYGFKWSERQLAIFEQIFWGYDHTQRYWDNSFQTTTWKNAHPGKDGPDNPSAKGSYHNDNITAQWKAAIEARRRALVNYLNPDDEGFNKYDSVRVDEFYRALVALPLNTSSTDGKPMSTLMWKTAFLGKKDAKYVLEESPDMRKKMKEHLVDAAYVRVQQLLLEAAGLKKATPLEEYGKSDVKNIQAVYDALAKVPVGTADNAHPTVKQLRYRTADLTKKQAKQVLEHEPKLLNKVDHHLTGEAHTKWMQLLRDCLG